MQKRLTERKTGRVIKRERKEKERKGRKKEKG